MRRWLARVDARRSGTARSAPPARVRDDLGPHDAALENLQFVTEMLNGHGIPFWVIRDRGLRHRVAVRKEDRGRTLATFADAPIGDDVRAVAIGPGRKGTALSLCSVATELSSELRPSVGADVLRIFRPYVSGTGTLKLGADCGCDLEFWDTGPAGNLIPARPTLIGDAVPANALEPAELMVGGRAHPSLAAFTRPLVDDIAFPIDAVYTWVDGGDPRWRARRDQTLVALGLAPSRADGGDSRYASRDELRYSLRSLAMFAPWIRHVWIVTDGQRPAWLCNGPSVTVVDHREIFSDPSALPTFNSHAIETQLHHIDGLAEHFLYLNDDFFFGRTVRPDAFFLANGISRFFPSTTAIPPGPRTDRDPTWIAAGKNNRALIEREFGRSTVSALKHAPYALRRSVLAEMEERFADAIERTAHSRIRSVSDIALVSSLYHYYAFSTARAVPAELAVDTVPLSHSRGQATLDRLLSKRDRDCFCLNDMASGDLSETDKHRIATAFMADYLPVPSPFEQQPGRERMDEHGLEQVSDTVGSATR
jgi:hypothetical protein